MKRASIDGIELEYELEGTGEPVVLVHWGVSPEWARPLLEAEALGGYLRLAYHRAGFAGSGRVAGRITMAEHARHCRLLMRHLGIERAHVVGHSSSAVVALQLALDFPDAVQTIVSMESARPTPPTEAQAEFVRTFVEPALSTIRQATRPLPSTPSFLVLRARLPLAARGRSPGYVRARCRRRGCVLRPGVAGPAAVVVHAGRARAGSCSRCSPCSERTQGRPFTSVELLLSWLPNVEPFDLPDARHLLHVENPDGMAEALAAFFALHPLGHPAATTTPRSALQ